MDSLVLPQFGHLNCAVSDVAPPRCEMQFSHRRQIRQPERSTESDSSLPRSVRNITYNPLLGGT